MKHISTKLGAKGSKSLSLCLLRSETFLQLTLNTYDDRIFRFNVTTKTGFYAGGDMSYDPSAYFGFCGYANNFKYDIVFRGGWELGIRTCNLFKPVLTDSGICHSFNAKNMASLLKPSLFKTAFTEAYKSDLGDPANNFIHMGAGPGRTFRLIFYLDNNEFFRPHTGVSVRIAVLHT